MEKNNVNRYVMEFVGTFFIVFFGCGTVFVAVYIGAFKDLLPVMWMWAFAVAIPVYVGAAVSGAHFNPSVTLALALFRGFPWRLVPGYVAAQFAGAFVGAAVLWFGLYQGFAAPFEAANHLVRGEFGSQLSSMVFATYIPNPGIVGTTAEAYAKVPLVTGFCSEFIGTALLMFMILQLLEAKNALKPSIVLFPYALGIVVFAIVALTAPLSMTSLNGARDLGPRTLAWLLGWGAMAFPGPRGDFWIPTIAPICGAVFAGWFHDRIFLRLYHTADPEPAAEAPTAAGEKARAA
jgi:glycerol uptake facilitator protein